MAEASNRLSAEQLFEKVRPSVVVIKVGPGTGSGFFTADGSVIATNAHVVEGSSRAKIKTYDGREFECPVVRSFKVDDIAFLYSPQKGSVPPLRASNTLKVGQTVMALGNPLGMEYTLSRGIISGVNQMVGGKPFIQTDASIAPGSSGGPLFDEYAMVVGVNSQVRGNTIGLAIPAELVHQRLGETVQLWPQFGATHYCPVCGERSGDAKYCGGCGIEREKAKALEPALDAPAESKPAVAAQQLSTGGQCRACKNTMSAGEKYCARCGASVAGV